MSIPLLGAQTLTVRRPGATTFVDGVAVDSLDQTLEILGSAQPVQARDRHQLPELLRVSAAFKLYTEADLQVTDLGAKVRGDVVELDDGDYEVSGRWDWTVHELGLPHNKYILTRVGDDEPQRP